MDSPAPSTVISDKVASKYTTEMLKGGLSEEARKEKQEKLDAQTEWLKQDGRGAKLAKQLSEY